MHSNFDLVSIYLPKCYEKVVILLDTPDQSDHLTKIEICKFLEVVGHKLLKHATNYIGLNSEFLVKRIQDLTKDRIGKVQMSARETLRIWKKVEKVYQELERHKTRVKFDVRDPEKLIEMNLRNNEQMDISRGISPPGGSPSKVADRHGGQKPKKAGREDSLEMRKPTGQQGDDKDSYSSKQNSIARGAEVFRSNNLVEKTHLKQRAHNFQKKRTGTGGGFISHFDPSKSRSQSKKKTCFNDVREQFKEQIMNDRLNFTNQRNDSRNMIRSKYQNNEYKRHEDGEEADEEPENNDNQDSQIGPNEYIESRVVSNWSRPPNQPASDPKTQPPVKVTESRKPAQQQPPPQEAQQPDPEGQPGAEHMFVQEEVLPGDQSAPMPVGLIKKMDVRRDSQGTMSSDRRSSGERLEGLEYLPSRRAPAEEHTVYASSLGDDDQAYEEYTLPAQSERGINRDPSIASTTYIQPNRSLNGTNHSMAETVYVERPGDVLPQYGDDQTVYYESSQDEEPDSPVAVRPVSRIQNTRVAPQNDENVLLFDEFVVAWAQALELLRQNRIDEAYRLLLDKDDDIYLLRLMNKTGVCYDKLSTETARRLKEKAARIGNSAALQNIALRFAQTDHYHQNPYADGYGTPSNPDQFTNNGYQQSYGTQMSKTLKVNAPSRLEPQFQPAPQRQDPQYGTTQMFTRPAERNPKDPSSQLMRIEEYPMQQPQVSRPAAPFERESTQSFTQPVPSHAEILARFGYVGPEYVATLHESAGSRQSQFDYLSNSQPGEYDHAGYGAAKRKSVNDSLALTASLASQEEKAAREQLEALKNEARVLYQQLGRQLN